MSKQSTFALCRQLGQQQGPADAARGPRQNGQRGVGGGARASR